MRTTTACMANALATQGRAVFLAACVSGLAPPAWPADVHAGQPSVGRVRVSPDGNRILAIANDGARRALAVSDLGTGEKFVALRAGDAQSLGTCDWVSTDRIVCEMFLFPGQHAPPYGRHRIVRLVAVDYDGRNPLPLLDSPPRRPPRLAGVSPGVALPYKDLENSLVSRLPGAPDAVLVSASREATPYTTVYRVDTRTGTSARVVGWQSGILYWHATWEGKVLLGTGDYSFGTVADEPWIGPTAVARGRAGRWHRIDVAHLSRPIGPRQVAGPRILGFSLDESEVYYEAAADDEERTALWVGDVAGMGSPRKLVADSELDVRAMPIGGRKCGVVGFAHVLPGAPLTWLDDELGAEVGAAARRNGLPKIVAVPSMSDDCRRLVLASTDDRTYIRFHLLDRSTGDVRGLGGHDVGVGRRPATERRTVRFPTRDGLALPMALTLPTAAASALPPVIVLLDDHVDDDPESLDTWPHFFAVRGYAVAQPAIRGQRGYGTSFRTTGLEMRGRRLREDVADALDWLSAQQLADGAHACIAGRGKGAHFALVVAVAPTDEETVLPRCAAAYAVLDIQATKRRHDEPLDSRVCGWFPCGDWEAWASPSFMRRAARHVPGARHGDKTLHRSPLEDARHPGFPILIKTEGVATIHEKGTRRFRADIGKTGFVRHAAPRGSAVEAEFLIEAARLFDEVLLDTEQARPQQQQ